MSYSHVPNLDCGRQSLSSEMLWNGQACCDAAFLFIGSVLKGSTESCSNYAELIDHAFRPCRLAFRADDARNRHWSTIAISIEGRLPEFDCTVPSVSCPKLVDHGLTGMYGPPLCRKRKMR
jgi:hypothetical protein